MMSQLVLLDQYKYKCVCTRWFVCGKRPINAIRHAAALLYVWAALECDGIETDIFTMADESVDPVNKNISMIMRIVYSI